MGKARGSELQNAGGKRAGRITGRQIRAARALLRLSQKDLSRISSVSSLTIVRMEAVDGPVARRATIVDSIVSAFKRRGIEFLSSPHSGVGVTLKPRRRSRR
jgi:hypothetical protein